jgi:hypothetical protein
MRNNSDSRQLTSFPLCLFTVVLVIGVTAYAQTGTNDPGGSRCSNRTLSGNYGYSAQGQVLPAPGLEVLFTSTGMVNFDGNGTLSWVEHTVVGGLQQGSDWTPASGTYTVNSDCTGTMVVVTPNSPVPLPIFFSVVQQGKQLYSVVNGNAITTVWTKIK